MSHSSKRPVHQALEKVGGGVVILSFTALLLVRLARGAMGLSERDFYQVYPVSFVFVCILGGTFILGLFVLMPIALFLRSKAGLPLSDVPALNLPVGIRGSRNWLSQLAAATLVGAVIPLVLFWQMHDAPGSLVSWIIGSAAAGFAAGLFLLSPSRFGGVLFFLVGVAVTVAPLSSDGRPVASVGDYAIKAAIGLPLVGLGVVLFRRSRKARRSHETTPNPPVQPTGFARG